MDSFLFHLYSDIILVLLNTFYSKQIYDGGFEFAYEHPDLGDATEASRTAAFARLAARSDRPVADVEREFRRKHRYVEYLVREGVDDFDELFAFLSDLRTDEPATVERVGHRGDAYVDD